MEIKTFAEMTPAVWAKIKVPYVAVWEQELTQSRPKYKAEVMDGDEYTGIHMYSRDLEALKSDISKYAPKLKYCEPGPADDPAIACIYL